MTNGAMIFKKSSLYSPNTSLNIKPCNVVSSPEVCPTPKPALVSTFLKVPPAVKSAITSCGNVEFLTASKATSHFSGDTKK